MKINRKYLIDHRENKGLHALYVKYAVEGILAIDRAIKTVQDLAKTTHASLLCAMFRERAKLIREDAAYAEAHEFLEALAARGLLTKAGECFFGLENVDE